MELFDISQAGVEEKRFTRTGVAKSQNFVIKYRSKDQGSTGNKSGHDFIFSSTAMSTLGINEGMGCAVVPQKDPSTKQVVAVAIITLPEDHEKVRFFGPSKAEDGKKSEKVNNTILEEALAEAGLIDPSNDSLKVAQKLDIEEYPDKVNFNEKGELTADKKGYSLYVLVEDTSEGAEEEAEEEEYEEEVEA